MNNNEKQQCKFLKVFSVEMAKYLTDCGYQCIYSDNNSWTYLNTNIYLFSDERIQYTNILCV